MRVALMIEAKHIPDGTTIRKPNGTNEYIFRRNGIPVYRYLGQPSDKRIILEHDLVLQSDKDISVCGPDNWLAVDFETCGEAMAFLEDIDDGEAEIHEK